MRKHSFWERKSDFAGWNKRFFALIAEQYSEISCSRPFLQDFLNIRRRHMSIAVSGVTADGRDMKLQQLKYLLAIVDNGLNITAAAERLYTSQPGVSKQLKLLEEELQIQLFVRKGKSLNGVTVAGHQVVSRARLIMKEVEDIRNVALRHFKDERESFPASLTHSQIS